MRKIICGFGLVVASIAFADVAPVADRVAKQNALFDEFYETGLKNSPERATSFGDYRYNALARPVFARGDRAPACGSRCFPEAAESDPDATA